MARKPTRKELIDHLRSEGIDILQLNKPAGAILIAVATALETGVETELAEVCLKFAEEQQEKFLKMGKGH